MEANDKNAIALQNLLSAIGLSLPEDPQIDPSSIPLCRAIVFSLFGGALLGAVLTHWSNRALAPEILAWMLSLGVFGAIFSALSRLSKNYAFGAIALGAAAGAAGQLALEIVQIAFKASSYTFQNFPMWLPKIVIGAVFGGCLAALTHGFRYYIKQKVRNCFRCYALNAAGGAAMFIMLGIIMGFVKTVDISRITFFAFLGGFVACVAALITNIFHERV